MTNPPFAFLSPLRLSNPLTPFPRSMFDRSGVHGQRWDRWTEGERKAEGGGERGIGRAIKSQSESIK